MTRQASALVGAWLLTGLAVAPAVAAPVVYSGTLLGSSEVPPVAGPGSGSVLATFDRVTHSMILSVDFSALTGTVTAAHIHCCVPGPGINGGVASQLPTYPGFPSGVSSGVYANTFNMSLPTSYNSTFVTSQGGVPQAEAALTEGMGRGAAYFNLHSTVFPAGEIRAYLFEQPIFANGFESP